jgi:D-lactate dehydrogenase
LRRLAVPSDGVNQVEVDACTDAGVSVCNTPHFGDPTVAEHTFALLLSLCRRHLLPYQPAAAENATAWQGWGLAGKALGVIGLGHVGRRVARFGHAFGMRVLAHDIAPDVRAVEGLGLRLRHDDDLRHWARPFDRPELAETVEVVSLGELLGRVDVVTLHTPYARQTRRLIDTAAIGAMKHGAGLLNTLRGGLVDLAAVRDALDRGWLGGVGLDVVEGDEAPLFEEAGAQATPRHTLVAAYAEMIKRPNVVISPHNAYNSAEARQRIVAATIDTIRAFLDGHPINVVQPMSWG